MKSYRSATFGGIVLLLCLAAYLAGSLLSQARAATLQYKIVQVDTSSLVAIEAQFNKMGVEGWQLVEWGRQPTAVFKRL